MRHGNISSEGFASYLQTLARFHSYSFGNVLLIRAQRPDASRVAGYRKWLELGRQVRKGEQGIKILVPYIGNIRRAVVEEEIGEDTVVVKGFGVGTVFDVAQTVGGPFPDSPASLPKRWLSLTSSANAIPQCTDKCSFSARWGPSAVEAMIRTMARRLILCP